MRVAAGGAHFTLRMIMVVVMAVGVMMLVAMGGVGMAVVIMIVVVMMMIRQHRAVLFGHEMRDAAGGTAAAPCATAATAQKR